ncbi:DUF4062 domain-containing protein [Antarcticimicrobium luteum]|uniref:DUF4062 domain-containing protein n=1 Tax=Antarcticimicrobium luteum TaxID=2547397 RepID=A0A4R5VE40_9RHOB|nr:DUF4062 domain-containing protein [Antarcticimicrobium luteum]TDK50429.1 DUF4062 domain-containing protein [Antarcticimicrobium luteum]
MSEKRYQVFISSTYEDLKEERKAVEQTIIRAGDFPVGMEAFPAADEEQFEFIKTIISQCDYYVLIIAGRYGSLAPDGKSYTEKEYDYAVEIGVPVLVMLRDERGELPANKTEDHPEKRAKLEAFIATVSDGRLRKGWTTTDGLKLAIREALDYAKATKHRPGWIRGDQSSSQETLERLVAVQEENERLKQVLAEAKPQVAVPENLAGLDTFITLTGKYSHTRPGQYSSTTSSIEIATSLGEIFELLAPHLMQAKPDRTVGPIICEGVWRRFNTGNRSGRSFVMTDELFQTIKIQLMALNLVSVKTAKTVGGGVNLFWSLTDMGMQEMVRRRAMTTEQ